MASARKARSSQQPPAGPASDAQGRTVVDPSILTTEASDRAKAAADKVDTLRDAALQRELKLRQEQRQLEVANLGELLTTSTKANRRLFAAELRIIHEKLEAERRIQTLIEDQRKERKEDDRRALDAALAAAEKARVADTEASDKANTKTELSTTEQLKLQQATANTANQGTVALLGQLQTRVERIENIKQGAAEQTDQSHARQSNIGLWAGVAVAVFVGFNGLLLTVVGIVATFILTRH